MRAFANKDCSCFVSLCPNAPTVGGSLGKDRDELIQLLE